MTRLVFVRHAEPMMSQATPAAEWPLTEKGSHDAGALGSVLASQSSGGSVWTSPERRARETAALAFPSVAVEVRPELREVKKPWYVTADEHENAVRKYFKGEAVEDWEHRDAVIQRITQLKSGFGSLETLALVSHGLLITTWLHYEVGLDDPVSFWSGLRMPDAWGLSLDQKSLRRVL